MDIVGQIVLLLLLTLLNAFFSGSEMAMVSVNKIKMQKRAEEGNAKAALILKFSEDSTAFLSTIQVAITFAGFFSSASAATGISQVLAVQMETWGLPYSGAIAMVVVTLILSYFNLVFGELVPKRIALQKAEAFSLMCVKPIHILSKVLAPFIKLLSVSTNGVLRLFGMKTENLDEEVTEEEIKSMLANGTKAGVFNAIEKEMINSIFSFDDKKAVEVMTSRQDVIAIDLEEDIEEYLDEILNSMHSRIPVYEGDLDHVVGILSMKDFMIAAKESSFYDVDIRSIMQKPYFVSERRKIDELFREMQKKKIHMAVLVDEYGSVPGIVTIEDLIEVIVGDIHEEHEEVEEELLELDDGAYQIGGGYLMYDLNEKFNLKLDSKCDTLSGYLIEQLGYIPESRELPLVFRTEKCSFTILEIEDRVIEWVRMELL